MEKQHLAHVSNRNYLLKSKCNLCGWKLVDTEQWLFQLLYHLTKIAEEFVIDEPQAML